MFFRKMWPGLMDDEFNTTSKHYVRLTDALENELATIEENPERFAFSSEDDLATLLNAFQASGEITKMDALQVAQGVLKRKQPIVDEMVLRSIEVVLRLWLTIDISSLKRWKDQDGLLLWRDNQHLNRLVSLNFEQISQDQGKPLGRDSTIDPELTAEALARNFGFTVEWTGNLTNHLKVDWKHRVITVYEHKICLYNHLRFKQNCPIPGNVLEEAIDTMNLLFPFQDAATKRFLAKHKKPFYGLGLCGRVRVLDLEHYSVWRGRLADLVYISRSPPVGLQQLRLDRHGNNALQFWTFWIATCVGILTLAGLGIGFASLVYTVRQYDIAVKQYEVSIIQLCLDPKAKAQLRNLCF
ncbi:hypothetical protein GQ53DRAFT_828740 [Thozetella sp. PMI_491]|nr:hypothetical protein GQ53DRAFT_828740 [Thozetella sp. PMI_491]